MMFQVGDDGVVSSVNEEDLIYVDKNELEQFVESYHQLEKENDELKQFQEKVATVIEGKMGDNVCNNYKMEVLKEIWNELNLDEVWFE